jgi:hypothetical protein
MSADSTFGAPYVFNDVRYPRVKMKGYAALEAALRDKRRAQARAIAADCGLAGVERAQSLREAETAAVTMYDVDDFTHTNDGLRLALRESLALDGKNAEQADQIIDNLDPNDARLIARHCLGFIELTPAKPKDQPAPKENAETASVTGS